MKNAGAILIARTSKKGKIKMKKAVQIISIIAILAVTLITLTGCMNINYEVKLNNDGSAEISYLMGYDKQFLKDMGISTDTL